MPASCCQPDWNLLWALVLSKSFLAACLQPGMLREEWITLWKGVTDTRCLHAANQLKQCGESPRFGTAGATAVATAVKTLVSLHISRWRDSQWAGKSSLWLSHTGNALTPQTLKWAQHRAVKCEQSQLKHDSDELYSTHQSETICQCTGCVLTDQLLSDMFQSFTHNINVNPVFLEANIHPTTSAQWSHRTAKN